MPYCRPASQFCCGCSTESGVKFILVFHLLRDLLVVAATVGAVVLGVPVSSLGGAAHEAVFVAALALGGLPLIAGALWGVHNRAEGPIRLYFIYMVISFLLDEGLTIAGLVVASPCNLSPRGQAQQGKALACGAWRGFDFLTLVTLTGVEVYFMYVVLSFCESMRCGGAGARFGDLQYSDWDLDQKEVNALSTYMGYADQVGGDGYGTVEGPIAVGLGGAAPIFGGRRHEMNYPPVHKPVSRASH